MRVFSHCSISAGISSQKTKRAKTKTATQKKKGEKEKDKDLLQNGQLIAEGVARKGKEFANGPLDFDYARAEFVDVKAHAARFLYVSQEGLYHVAGNNSQFVPPFPQNRFHNKAAYNTIRSALNVPAENCPRHPLQIVS